MKILAIIENVKTNQQSIYVDEFDYDDEDMAIFSWSEHNFSCDCNRSIYFYVGLGFNHNDAYNIPHECGMELYKVELINQENGLTIYTEYDND